MSEHSSRIDVVGAEQAESTAVAPRRRSPLAFGLGAALLAGVVATGGGAAAGSVAGAAPSHVTSHSRLAGTMNQMWGSLTTCCGDN